MKRLLLFLLFCVYLSVRTFSQSRTVFGEAQYTLSPNVAYDTLHNFLSYIRYTDVGKKHAGWFVDFFTDGQVNGHSVGVAYERTSWAYRAQGSLGVAVDYHLRLKQFSIGYNTFLFCETKPGDVLARWKVEALFRTYISRRYGWWHEGYATVSPYLKWVSLGVHVQSTAGVATVHMPEKRVLTGIRVQAHTPVFRMFFVAGSGKRYIAGMQVTGK